MSDLTFRKVDQYTLWQIATEGTPGDGTELVGTYLIAELPEGAQPGTVDEEVTDVSDLRTRHDLTADEAKEQMFLWLTGTKSHWNLGKHAPYTPDVTAVMDAQEVVKWAAAYRALRVVPGE